MIIFMGKSERKMTEILLDLPDEGEDRRDGLDADLPAVRVDQGPGAVAVVLFRYFFR